jgi:carbamoyltransferase
MKPAPVGNILGISGGFHDAAATLINAHGDIVFAGHAERYSKQKNDANINAELLQEFCNYDIDTIAYYERPWLKQLRNLRSGQGIDWANVTTGQVLQRQLGTWLQRPPARVRTYSHHLSHAAAGFQTSPFDRAIVVVIDAIGEFDTISIYGAEYDHAGHAVYKRLWRQQYPYSIGLFYSAITQRIGLHPLDEEYITMGMSAYGDPCYVEECRALLTDNLHIGIDSSWLAGARNEDIAASAQVIAEELIYNIMQRAKHLLQRELKFPWTTNLVYQGGVALNCLANRKLGEYFENIWIMPCPGDGGSSLGAAALAYGKRLNWANAYLGHEIPGHYPVSAVCDHLLSDRICGVASGRAEFGPRALGNRSLLADPRGVDIKDLVNEIKRRQQFRPFAPVILEEHVHDYFDMPAGFVDTRYMQVVGACKRPDLYPAITHVDGTSRIQTVPADGSGIRQLLEAWYDKTGCPMLLNTSLNIRGEPMVNDRSDADRFEQMYGVRVFS